MLRIQNVKVPLGKDNYKKIISQTLNIREKQIKDVKLVKQSIDARRDHVHFICSFDFKTDNDQKLLEQYPRLSQVEEKNYQYLPKNDREVLVVGSGPAGLFCAYVLSKVGQKVTVIERGQPIEKRVKDVEDLINRGILHPQSNIAFGEGGAGTFSDGKLTTGVKDKRLDYILKTFVEYGAPEDILYLGKPHIGTDYLRKVIVNMRKDMEKRGVTFLFNTQLFDFHINNEKYYVDIQRDEHQEQMIVDDVVLAIGHSARDTYEMLYQKGIHMEAKPFAVGVRIEQLQSKINEIQYKKSAHSPYLKAAPYKLAVKTKEGRGVYTFCMCPGGVVVPSMHEEKSLCVNGMSYYARDGQNANSAILVNVKVEDFSSNHPLAGIEFQRQLERKAFELGGNNYYAPVQKWEDYLFNQCTHSLSDIHPTYQPGYTYANLNELFPEFINVALKEGLQLMNKKMPGFIDEHTLLTGVEARSSAPVRIVRNENYQSLPGLYPIGEGAGYAGGIMSAALDGIKCAEMILRGGNYGSC